MSERAIQVAILMGSASDAPVVEPCLKVLDSYGISYEVIIRSAHRTPTETVEFVHEAEKRGASVFIAVAGMAAHLAGVVAAHTTRPVIGIPVASGPLQGQDALLSTVMMPPGIPVATVGINGAANAGHLAAEILSVADPSLRTKLSEKRDQMRSKVLSTKVPLSKE